MDAIILCGGLATRLRDVTEDKIPKCLVPINGVPFIKYQLDYLNNQSTMIDRVILALGRYSEQVVEYVQTLEFDYMNIFYSFETEPLGTGGAMKRAWRFVNDQQVIIMNGDVYNEVDISELQDVGFYKGDPSFTLSLKPMRNVDRYGLVELNEDNKITGWVPKQYTELGNINRGLYYVRSWNNPFEKFPDKFSFENDFVPKVLEDRSISLYGNIVDNYFIDIGIPEDYREFESYVRNNRLQYSSTPY